MAYFSAQIDLLAVARATFLSKQTTTINNHLLFIEQTTGFKREVERETEKEQQLKPKTT